MQRTEHLIIFRTF